MWGAILAFVRKQIGLPGDMASSTGSVHARLGDIKNQLLMAVASDNIQLSADTERTLSGSGATTYTLKKSALINVDGIIRVSFALKSWDNTVTAYGRIYKNGVAVGTERTVTGATYATFSEDLFCNKVDQIQLYIKSSNSGSVYCRNFRIAFDQTGSTPSVITD